MLKVTTWNVNGIRARASEVRAWLEREAPDVVCLQEVRASPENVPGELRELPGYFGCWHGYKGYSGVALLLSRATFGTRPEFVHPSFDLEARCVTAIAGGVLFASLYVPNGGKDFAAKVRFLTELDAFCAQAQTAGQPMVLCGDLNVSREERDVHPAQRNPQKIGQTPGEREQLERIIGRGLRDLSRQFHPDDDRLFTWWAPWRNARERNIGWRLDYVLASEALAARAIACDVQRLHGSSDHGPLLATFDLELPRGEPHDDPTPSSESRGRQLNLF
jgi:exodeoxyribonuclease III